MTMGDATVRLLEIWIFSLMFLKEVS